MPLIELAIQFVGLVVGLIAGGFNERRHLRTLDEREASLADMTLTNLKTVPAPESVEHADLVIGQVVIATDYYKSFVTILRNVVGGEMKAALRLLQRARREALLRMVDEARQRGAHEVCNIRFEFSNISQMRGNNGSMQVEMVCYGTAVRRAAHATPT